MTRLRAWLVPAALLIGTWPARALGESKPSFQAQTSARITAEALFDEALRDMDAGRYDQACARLEDSQQLDPGIGTLLYLGHCYQSQGRITSAWATFRQAATLAQYAGQSEREKIASDQAEALRTRLPRLELVATGPLPVDCVVRRDGIVVSLHALGVAIPLDPGPHTIELEAPGYEPYKKTIMITDEGETVSFRLPKLVHKPPPARPLAPARDDSARKTWAYALGGVGVLGVGVGTAAVAADGSETLATLSTALGAAALVTSGVLLVWPETEREPAPKVRVSPALQAGYGGVRVVGSF